MTEFQRRIIEHLIFEPCTAEQLAQFLRVDRQCAEDALQELSIPNLVRPRFSVALGDAVCERCGEEYEDAEPYETCSILLGGEISCGGRLIDVCLWVYCGGPISKALAAEEAAA